MTRHLLRLIWNRKRQNFLLTVEIFFAFLTLFGVVLFAMHFANNTRQPLGYDIARGRGIYGLLLPEKQVELDASRSEACATATANLAVYGSGDSVTLARGDGEPETLSGDALVAARTRAQRDVDAYCPKTTGA